MTFENRIMMKMLTLYGEPCAERLLVGTAGYPSLMVMEQAIRAAEASVVTVSLRRQITGKTHQADPNFFWESIKKQNCRLLPNTAGCHTARDAVTTAEMAREIFETDWIKLEVIGDDYTLQPDVIELLSAVPQLVQRGFKVFPYCTDDLVVCKRLIDAGCQVLMPWAAPIGSGQGILHPKALQTLRARLPTVTLIVDAGIGKPSHAAAVLEIGYDAVLLNSAIALATDPVLMAGAFRDAVRAGWSAYQAGCMPQQSHAVPSTPVLDTPFWLQVES